MLGGRRPGPVYRGQPKVKVPKSARNVALSAVVLFMMAFAGGIGYTFYMDSNSEPKAVAAAPVSSTAQPSVIKPVQPAADAKESAAVEAFTSMVAVNTNASISVKTNAGSACTIMVLYNNLPAKDSGLVPKLADDFGNVTWSWTVGPDTPLGMWPININCAYHGKSAFVQAQLDVTK